MKKIVLGMMIAALVLSGCGKDKEDTSTKEISVETEQSQVTNEKKEDTVTEGVAEEKTEEETTSEAVLAGVYQAKYKEEIEGTNMTMYDYLVLKDDGTGFWIVQDTVPITWNENKITDEFDSYAYKMADGSIVMTGEFGDTTYNFLSYVNIDEFLENYENPEFLFGIEDAMDILNSFVEEQADKNAFESFDELISNLKAGQGYSYIDVTGCKGKTLIIAENPYENRDGKYVSNYAFVYGDVDGSVQYLSVLGNLGEEESPVSMSDGVMTTATESSLEGYFYSSDGKGIMMKFSLSKFPDEGGNCEYSGFYRQTNSFDEANESWEVDEKVFDEYQTICKSAEPIEFTVVK